MDVINIDKHILRWAKVTHAIVEEPLEGNKGQKTRVEISYDRVKRKVVMQKEPDQSEPGSELESESESESESEDEASAQAIGKKRAPVDTNRDVSNVVFKSTYTNNTSVPQQHQFQMTRETAATIMTSLTKGFTNSGHVDIRLSVPDVISNVTGGFGPEVEVRQEEESRVHHSLTWSVNSTVNVPPRETTVATLVIKEVDKKFEFTATVIMRGTVLVKLIDLTTGQHKMVVQNDITTMLKDIQDKQTRKTDEVDTTYDDLLRIPKTVIFESGRTKWPIEGELNFRFGISQDVVVEPQGR